MARYRCIRDLDWPLLAITLTICALGVLQIYSATHDTHWRDAWWKQILWVGIAIGIMWVVTSIDYHSLLGQVPILYGFSIAALLATFAFGKLVFGSRRWIRILGFNLQISEFVKLVIILVVARYLSELKTDEISLRDLLRLGVLVGIPTALVMYQPDVGTGLTDLPVLASGILLAGLRWSHFAAILLVGALALPAGWYVLKDYQRARLETFINPARDPRGSGYQVIQSKIAVGDGGMWGRGVTRGTQTQLRFLPVPHTPISSFRPSPRSMVSSGSWWCWGCIFAADADRAECAGGARPGRHVHLHGCSHAVVVPFAGECRHGGG